MVQEGSIRNISDPFCEIYIRVVYQTEWNFQDKSIAGCRLVGADSKLFKNI